MTISAMIAEMMRARLEGGSDADLSRAIDEVNAAIDEMVENGPAFATDDWAQAKRDELRTAIQQARGQIEIDRAAAARRDGKEFVPGE